MRIPTFEVNYNGSGNIEEMIIDIDGFYVNMLNFILDSLYNGPSTNVLCYLKDGAGNEYTSTLEYEGFDKSLRKCLSYFEKKEEYEKCTLIKKLLNERL